MTTEEVRALRAEVADALAVRLRAAEEEGRLPLTPADQRMLGRQLVAEALDRRAADRLSSNQGLSTPDEEEALARAVFDDLFGLGALEPLLADESVENVNVNGADVVWVTYADGRKEPGPPVAASDAELVELVRTWAARLGLTERRFDTACPRLSLQLPDGSRLFATMAVSPRPCLSVRRHRFDKWFLHDLAGNATLDQALEAFLAAAVRARKNVVVCGGADAGKTTLLRAMANEIPPHERLVTIEDSFELGLDRFPDLHPDVVTMEAREPNVEGEGEVGLAELVRWALRMDPDRVIVGEVRGHEVIPMLNAMTLGNDGSMCSVHANSSAGVFGRLATYAVQAPERLTLEATNLLVANAVDFVVFLSKEWEPGAGIRRHVSSVREVVGADGPQVISNEVFRPGPDGRAIPAAPLRADTMDVLAASGFDPDLARPEGWAR